MVKTDTTNKEGFDVKQNRFFVKSEGEILYNYNHDVMATDPKTAAQNFLNALEAMPQMLERYQADNAKMEKDIPILKEVVESTFCKEPELKELKEELIKLDREIQLTLKPIENGEEVTDTAQKQKVSSPVQQDAPMPATLKEVKEIMGDRLIIGSVGGSSPKVEKKEPSKGFKL